MHISFLKYLVDPRTGQPLEAHSQRNEGDFIWEGELRSDSNRYPIVRGVPRFAGYQDANNYTNSFGYQWNKWARVQFESQNIGKPMQGYTMRMWEKVTSIESKDLGGALVLDYGCGPGRFTEIVRMKNGRAIGIDLSGAVEAAAENFRYDAGVLICQADILQPPIRPETVDGAFSIGVLHHTPNPRKGFQEMVKTVKPGGWAALAVYGKGTYYDFPTVTLYRNVFRALWPALKHYPPLLYSYAAAHVLAPLSRVPILGQILRGAFPFVRLPDAQWSVLDTFDSVTTSYQSSHESYEVFGWLKQAGLEGIEPSDWGFSSYHAMKPAAAIRKRAG